MNLGLVTSYIIAGLLMLSIVIMNINLSNSSSELTITEITRQHTQTISEMITYDIPKIGFASKRKVDQYETSPGGPNYEMIEVADSTRLVFYSDIDNNGSIDKVTWRLTNTKVYSSDPSKNQDIVILERIQGTDVTQIRSGVTRFKIRYYSSHGSTTEMATPVVSAANRANIRQIEIELMVQSKQKIYKNVKSDGDYIKSVWVKRFSPGNLENTN